MALGGYRQLASYLWLYHKRGRRWTLLLRILLYLFQDLKPDA